MLASEKKLPSLEHEKVSSNLEHEKLSIEAVDNNKPGVDSLISFEEIPSDIIRQPSPPPVLAQVQDLVSPDTGPGPGPEKSTDSVCSESPLELHIVRFQSLLGNRIK